jgi:hypothetical protein
MIPSTEKCATEVGSPPPFFLDNGFNLAGLIQCVSNYHASLRDKWAFAAHCTTQVFHMMLRRNALFNCTRLGSLSFGDPLTPILFCMAGEHVPR